jgi:hypothetical protein
MSRIDTGNAKSFGLTARFLFGIVASVMVPPFVMLAVAPMLLVLAPVAFVAIPFMLSAFATEVREVPASPRRVRALQHAHLH